MGSRASGTLINRPEEGSHVCFPSRQRGYTANCTSYYDFTAIAAFGCVQLNCEDITILRTDSGEFSFQVTLAELKEGMIGWT